MPGAETDVGGREVAVEEDGVAGAGAAQQVDGRGASQRLVMADRDAALRVDAGVLFGLGLVADEACELVERGGVGDAGAVEGGAMVGEQALGAPAVERAELGEVLPDGDEA